MFKIKVFLAGVLLVSGNLVSAGSDLLSSCSNHETRARIVATATAELHVREDLAANDAVRIREYKSVIKSRFNYPVAWCGIFTAYCFKTNGIEPPKGAEWVPSWTADKKRVIYQRGHSENQYPCPGDAVTFYYPKQGREGHVGIVKTWPIEGNYFWTIEGNTNAAGSREGDGVYIKMRRKTDAYKIIRLI